MPRITTKILNADFSNITDMYRAATLAAAKPNVTRIDVESRILNLQLDAAIGNFIFAFSNAK